jgi:glycosyltransferase involved in cell wall biosynthesis
MIVKNEEKNLLHCLSAMKPAVDEIIVVDTGSTDRTKGIAAALGAKVFDIPWQDDFSEARNFSLAKATCDWILVLDADEVIAPSDFARLRGLTASAGGRKTRADGFILTTRNYSGAMNTEGWMPNDGFYTSEEAGPGWYPSRKVRLFKNDDRIRFKGSVHELVEESMVRHKLKIHSSDIPVHHHGTLKAIDGVDKGEVYYQLGKKKIGESPGNARAVYELAVQAARLCKYDEAYDLWQQFLGSASKEDLHLAYVNLGHVCLEKGRYEEAARACRKALDIDAGLKEAHLNLAMSDFYMGRPDETAVILDKLIGRIPDYIPARALLAAAFVLTGETGRYEATVDPMRKTGTNAAVFFQAYAEKLLSVGREEDALRLLEAARNVWRDLLRSRGIDASDAEIERVMALAGQENPPPWRAPGDINVDPEFQGGERGSHPPAPRPE